MAVFAVELDIILEYTDTSGVTVARMDSKALVYIVALSIVQCTGSRI